MPVSGLDPKKNPEMVPGVVKMIEEAVDLYNSLGQSEPSRKFENANSVGIK